MDLIPGVCLVIRGGRQCAREGWLHVALQETTGPDDLWTVVLCTKHAAESMRQIRVLEAYGRRQVHEMDENCGAEGSEWCLRENRCHPPGEHSSEEDPSLDETRPLPRPLVTV